MRISSILNSELLLEFIQSEHPRDDDGRFTRKDAEQVVKSELDAVPEVRKELENHLKKADRYKKSWFPGSKSNHRFHSQMADLYKTTLAQLERNPEQAQKRVEHIMKFWRKSKSNTWSDHEGYADK